MTTEILLTHLARGGMIMNQYGTTIHLDKMGCQVINRAEGTKNQKTFYRLDSPEYWQCLPLTPQSVPWSELIAWISVAILLLGLR